MKSSPVALLSPLHCSKRWAARACCGKGCNSICSKWWAGISEHESRGEAKAKGLGLLSAYIAGPWLHMSKSWHAADPGPSDWDFFHLSPKSCQTGSLWVISLPVQFQSNCYKNFEKRNLVKLSCHVVVQTFWSFFSHQVQGTSMIMKSSAYAQNPPWHVPVWPAECFHPVRCAVVKQWLHSETLKVRVSVRRRWKWESPTPLENCSPATLTSAGLYHHDGRWEAKEAKDEGLQRKTSEKGIVNEVQWWGSTCSWLHLTSASGLRAVSHCHCIGYTVICSSQRPSNL